MRPVLNNRSIQFENQLFLGYFLSLFAAVLLFLPVPVFRAFPANVLELAVAIMVLCAGIGLGYSTLLWMFRFWDNDLSLFSSGLGMAIPPLFLLAGGIVLFGTVFLGGLVFHWGENLGDFIGNRWIAGLIGGSGIIILGVERLPPKDI